MKVSDITTQTVADYLRLAEVTPEDETFITALISAASAFIQSYTGHTAEELDDYQDFTIVALVLVEDMYDNRSMYVDSKNLNNVVESILGLHSVNLLPQVSDDD